MSVFEFVLGLLSIVGSLAITHLVTGVAQLIRHRKRVKFSLLQLLWMLSAFSITVGNWAENWEYRSLAAWPAWSILLNILSGVGNYLICYLVTPEIEGDGPIDLVDFQARERNSYLGAFIGLGLLSLALNPIFGAAADFQGWFRDSLLVFVALFFAILALLVKAKWAQWIGAAGFAAVSIYFMVLATNVATS
ncbi:MAG TPA: hypothetical protein VG942_04955 [Hyphomonadaceae bacterium]|nr:hypothetical protein [Hyphomonadaceae bacterium]